MRERLKRCESLLWLFMKLFLYISLMAVFMLILSIENKPLLRLSNALSQSGHHLCGGGASFPVDLRKI